jgi:flavin-dependent dehydrogenase
VGDDAGFSTLDMSEGIHPAVKSGLLAANAILHSSQKYRVDSISKYSYKSIFRFSAF